MIFIVIQNSNFQNNFPNHMNVLSFIKSNKHKFNFNLQFRIQEKKKKSCQQKNNEKIKCFEFRKLNAKMIVFNEKLIAQFKSN